METPLLLELGNLNFASYLKALWAFAALVLAAVFATRSRTLVLLLLPRIFLSGKSVIPHPSSSYASFSYSDDDDDDSCSDDDDDSDDEGDDNEETKETTPPRSSSYYNIYDEGEEFQGQYGNFDRVVKFWDEAFRSGPPPPPSSVLTAEEEAETGGGGNLAVVRLWDARSPEVVATWRAEGEAVAAGFGRREERVYVGDGAGRVTTVVDLRNVRSALGDSWRPELRRVPIRKEGRQINGGLI